MNPPAGRIVQTSIGRRFRLWRQQFLPIMVWSLAVAACVVLAKRQAQYIDAVGIVEVRNVVVAPLIDGTIHGMSVDVLDLVHSGDVVALMDDTLVKSELMVAEAELGRLDAELQAESARIDLELANSNRDAMIDMRRLALDEEEARLEHLDRLISQETDRVTLQRLELRVARQKSLTAEMIDDESVYDETRLLHDALKTQIEENEAAIRLARVNIDTAKARRAEAETLGVAVAANNFLAPFSEALTVQHKRIEEIKNRSIMLTLKAPMSGQVSTLFHRTGETVLSGDPVMLISDTSSQRILAYVDQSSARKIKVDTEVEIHSRGYPTQIAQAKVVKVGSTIEEYPLALKGNSLMTRRGLPLLVTPLKADVFIPGEILDLRIKVEE